MDNALGATEGVHDLHMILVLLLTFGAASALDRFVQSHWVHEVLRAIQTSQEYAGWFR